VLASRPSDPASQILFKIKPVRSAGDVEAAVQLFNAYASALGVDLGYQDFDTELATLPGKYAPPAGELLLARDNYGEPRGCVGLRPLMPDRYCEMKRLYVSPSARGLGLGSALIDARAWTIALLVPLLVLMHVGIIAREEEYLERKFGGMYREYKSRVRRWL